MVVQALFLQENFTESYQTENYNNGESSGLSKDKWIIGFDKSFPQVRGSLEKESFKELNHYQLANVW